MDYMIYVADVETTGLDSRLNDVIELSLIRLNDGVQKTWCLKPFNLQAIDAVALKINGHKLEDITHQTKLGRDTYLDPSKVIVEIENWVMEDDTTTSNRILCGQNISFDKDMLTQLWTKCGSPETMPFSDRRAIDTMQIEFFLDLCQNSVAKGYNLNALTKKYGVKNEKAHSAAADTLATKEVFEKQLEFFKKILSK
jgi:DNA polymerase III alpha subunit (gram-positive type)